MLLLLSGLTSVFSRLLICSPKLFITHLFCSGITIIVATPGRLLDHLQTTQAFVTSELQYLVLDEADRLLDMGFEKDVMTIVTLLRQYKAEAGRTC